MEQSIKIIIRGNGEGNVSLEVDAHNVTHMDIMETMISALASMLYQSQTPTYVREVILEMLPDILVKIGEEQQSMIVEGKEAQFLAALHNLGFSGPSSGNKEDK